MALSADPSTSIVAVASIIQVAVAPVFLLTGIAGLLGVMANRLGRITDRARVLERRLAQSQRDELVEVLNQELTKLWRRARMINRALSLGTIGALLVCVVIVTLFVADVSAVDLSNALVFLFVSAMLAVIGALLFFIREVYLATAQMRTGLDSMMNESSPD